MKKISGEFCTQKFGDELQTFSLQSNEKAQADEQSRYCFATTQDRDGGEHFGVKLTDEEIESRIQNMREFWQEGMIPWICPSCGKLWGANYDVGSLRWFECHFCGAEWELINPDETDSYLDKEKRKLKIHVVN